MYINNIASCALTAIKNNNLAETGALEAIKLCYSEFAVVMTLANENCLSEMLKPEANPFAKEGSVEAVHSNPEFVSDLHSFTLQRNIELCFENNQ